MALYVDDVRHAFGRMIMCHMWATTTEELHLHAQRLGLKRTWFQQPPKASWEHYDISLTVKARALSECDAFLTDKYGPVEHVARLNGDARKLEQVARCREMFGLPLDGILKRGIA